MQRNLLTLAIAGVLGLFVSSSDAQACHKSKKCATPTVACAPVPTCAPAPIVCEQAPVVCEPAPVVCAAPVKKCGFGSKLKSFRMPKFGGLCHKKASYAVASCDTCATGYAAPVYAAPQGYASPQGFSSPQVLSSGQ